MGFFSNIKYFWIIQQEWWILQLYTLHDVKGCLLTTCPTRPTDTHTHAQTHAHWGEKEVDNRRVTLRWSSLLNSFCWATIQAGQATQRSVQLGFPTGYCYYHSPAQVEEGDLRKAILSPAEWDRPRFLGGSRSVSQSEACCSTVSSRWEEQQQHSDSLVQSSAQ